MDFLDIAGLVVMLLLRVGVPVAVTAGLVYLLKRLDRRWEEEARAGAEIGEPAEAPAKPRPVERPATPRRAPAPELPFIPPPAYPDRRQQPGLAVAPVAPHCWDVKGCTPDQLEKCAAPQHPEMPCWEARLAAEGRIPEECVNCDIFQRYPVM